MSGRPFGDPHHPYRYTSEVARKAGQKGKMASPWSKRPFLFTKNVAEFLAKGKPTQGDKK